MLRKNTAGQNLGFRLVSASTGAGLTGATVTTYRSIDGGAQAAATGTVTEKGNGQYNFAPSQADTNGNQISYLWVATGAVPEEKTIVTTAADPTNATTFGLTNLDATVSGVPAAVWANATRTLTAFGFNPAVTLLSSAQTALVSAVWQDLTSSTDFTTAGSIGALLKTYTAAPTAAQIAAAVLTDTTAGDLATPGSLGHIVTTAPSWYAAPPTDYQQRGVAVTLPSIPAGWITSTGIAAAALNSKGDWLTGLGANAPAGWINAAAVAAAALSGKGDWNTVAPDNTTIGALSTLLSGLVVTADHTQFTAHALALAPASSGGGSVTVSGYAAGMDPAAQILATPANKLATDATGKVGASNLPADYQQRNVAVTLPAIPANWITGTGIAAAALAGKGDWLTSLGTNAPANWINAAAVAAAAFNGKGDWNTVAPDNTSTAAIKAKTDALPTAFPAVDGSGHVTLAPAGLDQIKIEGLYNIRQTLGLAVAILNGLVSGMDADAPVFRGIGTGAGGPARASYTTDASGNRLTGTLTPEA